MDPTPQPFVETHTGLVCLSLWGDFEPEVAIREIGLMPFNAKEPKEYPHGRRANVSFSKGKRTGESLDVYAMVDELFEEIAPKAKSIRDFAAAVNGEICLSIVLEISTQLDGGSTPAIGLSASAVSLLAALNASLDVDTYLLTGES